MRTTTTRRALMAATLLLAAMLAGCGSGEPEPAPSTSVGLLAEHGLDGLGAVAVIDRLDRQPVAERPTDLMASVRPHELVVSRGEGGGGDGAGRSLKIPGDRFYLSVAPYVSSTHDCFHHSLTTCKGELSRVAVRVRIVDETHDRVLVDETRTTFDNGFTGFWLPRDIAGTVHITYDGKAGEVPFETDEDAPTCLTTLRLA